MDQPQLAQKDHDILVRLEQKVTDFIIRIDDINSKNTSAIGELKAGKLDSTLFSAHVSEHKADDDARQKEMSAMWSKVDFHSKMIWISIGIVATIQFFISFLADKIFK